MTAVTAWARDLAKPAAKLERQLEREGLAPLDFDDGAGGIKVGNRGSGKILDSGRALAREHATAAAQNRVAILGVRRRWRRGERKVYRLYADGLSTRTIAKRIKLGRMAVFRIVARIEREHRTSPEQTIGQLLEACDPSTLMLVFTLLELAVDDPRAARKLLSAARSVPEIRQLLEPDEVGHDG